MSAPATSYRALTKIPFKNVHAESVPPFGVMQVTGSVVEDGVAFLACTRPGTELTTEFAINGPWRVHAGEKGICYREGDLQVAYDSGTPLAGERWGVRANQWTLSRGYPSLITVHAVKNVDNKILFGRFTPFDSVLGAPLYDVAAVDDGVPGSQTAVVQVWDGSGFSVSSPAMGFVGYNISDAVIKAGKLAQFVAAQGLWLAGGHDEKQAIVTIVDAEEHAPGTAIGPVTECLWSAKLTTVAAAAGYCSESPFAAGDSVWVIVLDRPGGSSTAGTALVVGDRYLAYKVADAHSVGEVSRPLYAIRKGAYPLVRFELTADLAYATDPSEDNAVLMTWHDGAYHPDGAAIRVFDFTHDGSHGTWSGKGPGESISGFQGWAVLKPDGGRYEIVWMEQPARYIQFALYAELTSADALQASVVVAYWDGRNPDPAGVGVAVYNLPKAAGGTDYLFTGHTNDSGYATWDEKLGRYRIVCMKQGGGGLRRVLAQLDGDLYPLDTANVKNIVALDNGTAPTITQANNWLYLAGNDDELCLLQEMIVIDGETEEPTTVWFVDVVQGKVRRRVRAQVDNAAGFTASDASVDVDNISTFDGSTAPTITVADNPLGCSGNDNDVLILEEDTTTSPSTWFVASGRPGGRVARRFKGTLNETLSSSDSTIGVGSLAALDGGATPGGSVTANNLLKWAGEGGDHCLITEDWSSGEGVAYILEHVEWDEITPVTDVFTDDPELKQDKTPIIGKLTGETAATTIDATLADSTVFDVVIDVDISGTSLRQTKFQIRGQIVDDSGGPDEIDPGATCP